MKFATLTRIKGAKVLVNPNLVSMVLDGQNARTIIFPAMNQDGESCCVVEETLGEIDNAFYCCLHETDCERV